MFQALANRLYTGSHDTFFPSDCHDHKTSIRNGLAKSRFMMASLIDAVVEGRACETKVKPNQFCKKLLH